MDKGRNSGKTKLNTRVRGHMDEPVARVSFIMWTGMSMMVSGATIEQMVSGFTRRYRELSMLANG